MAKLPVLKGRQFIKILNRLGFTVVRVKGAHHRLKAADGRVTTVPVHGDDDLPKGLLRKIIGKDLKLSLAEFNELYKRYKGR